MNRKARRAAAKKLEQENKKYSEKLEPVPAEEWPYKEPGLLGLYRSKDYLVQVYAEKLPGLFRLSVCRTKVALIGGWEENITWDALQEIKNECGFENFDAVEIYPKKSDVVNVANMRHLWVLPAPLPFAWRQ